MALRDDFIAWGVNYADARAQAFAKHATATWVRRELPNRVLDASRPNGAGLIAKGSAGAGNWAQVSWVALFDPAVTTNATAGYYVVYLLSEDGLTLHLSLNQGTTAVTEEFKSRAKGVLRERSIFMRQRIADYLPTLPVTEIDLGGDDGLPADYEAGHALGQSYFLANLPDEAELVADLHRSIQAYRSLTYRGGLNLGEVVHTDEEGSTGGTIEERRQYRLHLRIERNANAGRLAKGHHGYVCQCCDFDFEATYGELGKEFIEAHHLRPLSELAEGASVSYDIPTDFAVLCANCHRMIHRLEDVSDLAGLRSLVASLR